MQVEPSKHYVSLISDKAIEYKNDFSSYDKKETAFGLAIDFGSSGDSVFFSGCLLLISEEEYVCDMLDMYFETFGGNLANSRESLKFDLLVEKIDEMIKPFNKNHREEL